MGRKVTVSTVDDMTGRDVNETDGVEYPLQTGSGRDVRKVTLFISKETAVALDSIFANADNAEATKGQTFAEYLFEFAPKSTRAARKANGSGDSNEAKAAREYVKNKFDAPTIKTWARENGLGEFVKDGPGTLSTNVILPFAKAHGFEYAAPANTEPAQDTPAA